MSPRPGLTLAHKKLDATVAAAYGLPADLSDEQLLERLLALNLERAGAEAKAARVTWTEVAGSQNSRLWRRQATSRALSHDP
jgi:hypothetical protein